MIFQFFFIFQFIFIVRIYIFYTIFYIQVINAIPIFGCMTEQLFDHQFIEYYWPVVILAYKVNCQHWFHHYLSIRKILPDPYFLPSSHYPLKSFPQMEMAFIDASLSLLDYMVNVWLLYMAWLQAHSIYPSGKCPIN